MALRNVRIGGKDYGQTHYDVPPAERSGLSRFVRLAIYDSWIPSDHPVLFSGDRVHREGISLSAGAGRSGLPVRRLRGVPAFRVGRLGMALLHFARPVDSGTALPRRDDRFRRFPDYRLRVLSVSESARAKAVGERRGHSWLGALGKSRRYSGHRIDRGQARRLRRRLARSHPRITFTTFATTGRNTFSPSRRRAAAKA